MKNKRRFAFSTTQIVLIGFLLVILIGSILLSLPISSKSREAIPYVDALFTATSATCVTGLVTVTTATAWSIFGQAVILVLIQVGGLGIVTVMSGFMIMFNRRIGMKNSQLIQDALNLNTLYGLASFVKRVIIGTAIIEGAGALLYMTVFVPEYGARGIWISVFNSVSSFCNAGLDIIGESSLCDYVTNPLINAVTCALIVLGGLGYVVWWDVIRVTRSFKRQRLKCFHSLTLQSKVVIAATLILIFGGAILIMLFEYNNPLTIGGLNFLEKTQASIFQSVTTRTAGYITIPQENFTNASAILCILLMFIGGSPVGTAGGIKTVTIVVLVATAYSMICNKNEVTLFNRDITRQTITKAVAVSGMSFAIVFLSTLALSAAMPDAAALDVLYETVSATATVGLSRALTPTLNLWGKIIIILAMYFGRIGPISLAVAFSVKKDVANIIKNPTEDISVG